MSEESIPGYDPRTDPDSEHYDPDYDPEAPDPWDDPNYDPFESDYDPDTGERIEDESEHDYEKVCEAIECEIAEVDDGYCCLICYVDCNDGSGYTTAEPIDCEDSSSL